MLTAHNATLFDTTKPEFLSKKAKIKRFHLYFPNKSIIIFIVIRVSGLICPSQSDKLCEKKYVCPYAAADPIPSPTLLPCGAISGQRGGTVGSAVLCELPAECAELAELKIK